MTRNERYFFALLTGIGLSIVFIAFGMLAPPQYYAEATLAVIGGMILVFVFLFGAAATFG